MQVLDCVSEAECSSTRSLLRRMRAVMLLVWSAECSQLAHNKSGSELFTPKPPQMLHTVNASAKSRGQAVTLSLP